MCLQKLLSGLRVKSQALQKSNNEANSVGTGEFEVGRRREFRVDLNNFLQQDSYGANRMPKQDGKIG